MNKTTRSIRWTHGLILVILLSLTAGLAHAAGIDISTARSVALTDAGVEIGDLIRLSIERETEQGQRVYDVEFSNEKNEYDYWISVDTGMILKRSYSLTDAYAREIAARQATGEPKISIDQAHQIALDAAEQDNATIWIELDVDEGVRVYDVTLYTESELYEIELDCMTGEVYALSMEILTERSPAPLFPTQEPVGPEVVPSRPPVTTAPSTANVTPNSTANAAPKGISLEEAKTRALSDAGVAASGATFTKAKSDWDDGRSVYDIAFTTATHAYEYEIDAISGAIRDRDVEKRKSATTQPSTSYIGVDQAKSIAVKHAGLRLDRVTFTKAKLERDDGVQQYEIEFRYNGREYEYEIRASDGKILSADSEYDD